jgi:hypothetical protein
MGEIFQRTSPETALTWTGERLTTETTGQVEIEHLHRYFFARSLSRGLDVLDVASGEGYGTALLAQVAKSVVGVEIDAETVKHATAAYSTSNIEFRQGDARRIPCADASFDMVVSFETLEHFYEHDQFIAEVHRVLRPGGTLIVSSPERDVYSPAGGTPNPYHVHELTHAEFNTLMRSNFKHVSLYAQRPMLGSTLIAEEPGDPAGQLLTYEKRNDQLFEASVGLPRPIYLTAVASNEPFKSSIGSLYIETSGIEAIFAKARSSNLEIVSLTERLLEQGDYGRKVQTELNRRNDQLAAQVSEAQEWHRQLIQRTNDLEALGREVASLTQRLIAETAQAQHWHQQVVRSNERNLRLAGEVASLTNRLEEQKLRSEEIPSLLGRLATRDLQLEALATAHAKALAISQEMIRSSGERLAETTMLLEGSRARAMQEVQAHQVRNDALALHIAELEGRLWAITLSTSWRLTAPFRGIASRHPRKTLALRSFAKRHPRLRGTVIQGMRLAWRILTFRMSRISATVAFAASPNTLANSLALSQAGTSSNPIELVQVAWPSATVAGQVFKLETITPGIVSDPPLPRGNLRRALCIGHVLPYPPRAGNEYRIHKLLSWFASEGWELLVVVCPLPHEMPSKALMARAAAVYPNLIICGHDGTLLHSMTEDLPILQILQPWGRINVPALLKEDSGDPGQTRIINLLRSFCPDVLVELLLQLQDSYKPELLLAEYIFMTRPFPLLRSSITKVIDTIDVFSTKASKVEAHGVSDGLAMTEAEEAALLREADILIAIQAEEARSLERLAPAARVVKVAVDFPVHKATEPTSQRPSVLLVASANPMNVSGLQGFLREAWPSVLQAVPAAELLVVGAIGDTVEFIPEGVSVLGKVDDLNELYTRARIVINPAIAGTGLKIKTVEALCHLRPIVCWPAGVDGIADGARLFCHVATDWQGFTNEVVRLLQDDGAVLTLENKAQFLEEMFSTASVYAPLRDALQDVAQAEQTAVEDSHPPTLAYDLFLDLSTTGLAADTATTYVETLKRQGGL